ncbi:MAG: sulfotransferase domain-containing protein [Patescibacteria group bacterium]
MSISHSVFIVGLYKCGTSWLSHIFDKHDEFRAVREIDIIKCAYGKLDNDSYIERESGARTLRFFGLNDWCMLPKAQVPDKSFFWGDAKIAIKKMAELTGNQFGQANNNRLQSFFDFDLETAAEIFAAIRDAQTAKEAVEAFVQYNQKIAGKQRLVFKAADQIAVFEKLQELFPTAAKIMIIRDGRDAAISASKFKILMSEKKVPWLEHEDVTYFELLNNWKTKTEKGLKIANTSQLYLLKYEDLKSDFEDTTKNLLQAINAQSEENLIAEIKHKTSFKTMSGGREAGEEKKAVMRKGITEEWRSELNDNHQLEAWKIAGDILEAAGYKK